MDTKIFKNLSFSQHPLISLLLNYYRESRIDSVEIDFPDQEFRGVFR